jgi:hypothetical protein
MGIPDEMGCILYLSQALKCGFGFVKRISVTPYVEDEYTQELSKKGMTRWERASSAIAKIEGPTAVNRGAFQPIAGKPRYT